MANELLALAYDRINDAKASRLRACATRLSFAVGANGEKRLVGANFCRVRLCPMCQWRRALKVGAQTSQIIDAFVAAGVYRRYVLLTLTVRNVVADDLQDAIDDILVAWSRLTKRPDFVRAVRGWYRALEVTHNVYEDKYHPHLHCLLSVMPSYPTSRNYISQARWTELWASCLHISYTPIVDVRMCNGSTASAVAEVAKYACKPGDYLIPDDWDMTVDVVRMLDRALDRRRLVMYGGELKAKHKELHLDDIETGSLTDVGPDELPSIDADHVVTYIWYSGYRQYCAE